MTGSRILDVAIGLAFTYLLLSLVCSGLNEIVAALLALRQSTLSKGIQRLLADSPALHRLVYEHPLVRSLHHGAFEHTRRPSYIPPALFASSLLDVLRDAKAIEAAIEAELEEWKRSHEGFTAAQLDEELKAATARAAAQVKTVKASIDALLRGTRFGEKLDQKWEKLGDLADQERKAIGCWFDAAMTRLSGEYKRRAQWILLVISAVVVLGMNADSVAIAKSLWTDPALRESVAAQAKAYISRNPQLPAARTEPGKAAPGVGDAQQPAEAKKADDGKEEATPDAVEELAVANQRYVQATHDLEALGLPLGWPAKYTWTRLRADLPGKALGLLFTILAITLGAPFWFDTLNRLANLRSAGAKPGEGPGKLEPQVNGES
jgi:hypothetical protein